jgi:hypothetical protein
VCSLTCFWNVIVLIIKFSFVKVLVDQFLPKITVSHQFPAKNLAHFNHSSGWAQLDSNMFDILHADFDHDQQFEQKGKEWLGH